MILLIGSTPCVPLALLCLIVAIFLLFSSLGIITTIGTYPSVMAYMWGKPEIVQRWNPSTISNSLEMSFKYASMSVAVQVVTISGAAVPMLKLQTIPLKINVRIQPYPAHIFKGLWRIDFLVKKMYSEG